MSTIAGDHNFKYIYQVQFEDADTVRLLDADSGEAGIQALLNPDNDATGAGVFDDIDNSSALDSDNVNVLGDRPGDQFSVNDAGVLNGTYQFVSAATTSDPGGDPGFIAKKGDIFYFFTDTPFTGAGSRDLTLLADSDQAICFLAGTAIATPTGPVMIEHLAIGDIVMTGDGREAPVRWVGRQTVSTLFADELRLPVRIKAGALGENLPARDLLVSNDHALLVEGVLVQAGALVNEVTILRERDVPPVFVYYHVELDDHALILAENVPAESFIDNVERFAFDNWAEHEALYPNGRAIEEMRLPRAKAHRQLPAAVRSLLARRIAALGMDTAAAA
jgi:hypothetical protein